MGSWCPLPGETSTRADVFVRQEVLLKNPSKGEFLYYLFSI